MLILKKGETITFDCPACGCEFVAGIKAVKTDQGNYYCKCPMCGSECHTDVSRQNERNKKQHDRE